MRLPTDPRTACMALLAASLLLGGCAYKNPLMDDSASKRATASVAAANAPATASNPSGPVADSSVPARGPAASGTPNTVASATVTPPQEAATTSNKSLTTTREKRWFGGLLTPYRTDIQQGNFVSHEMVSQLKPGMTPEQVRFVLGTPLLADIFHANRWDYVFELKRTDGVITRGRLSVFFKDQRLERWEGGDLPNEEEYLARISGGNQKAKKSSDAAPASPVAPSTAKEPK